MVECDSHTVTVSFHPPYMTATFFLLAFHSATIGLSYFASLTIPLSVCLIMSKICIITFYSMLSQYTPFH